MKAVLALEDGTTFTGRAFGLPGQTHGEVVFNTSLVGYQEVLTDPSYHGQIVVMTNPLVGNYGISPEDDESDQVQVTGFVIRELSRVTSNFRSEKSLDLYLKEQGVLGISDIDTRALTRHLRDKGSMRGVISTICNSPQLSVEKAKGAPSMKGLDLVKEVTCKEKKEFTGGLWRLGQGFKPEGENEQTFHVAALDLGIKKNIMRHLADRGCRVTLLPASTTAEEIKALNPDGLFLSNGPGDPEPVPVVQDTVRALIGEMPVFGICLGHQIFCLAMGAKTFKLKFGHRGINHPVMDVPAGNIVHITSQNHGFAVDRDSLPECLELTHYSLYDNTVEGVRHKEHPAFTVQYHPEASPGPHDTHRHFDAFIHMMKEHKGEA